MKTLLVLASLSLVWWCSGCNSMARTFPYRVVVVNLSREKITENRILDATGTYNYGCGNLVPSGYAANAGPMETAPNDVFTISWKDELSQKHEQTLDLRKRVKRAFTGELVFILRPDRNFTVEIYESPNQYPLPRQERPPSER